MPNDPKLDQAVAHLGDGLAWCINSADKPGARWHVSQARRAIAAYQALPAPDPVVERVEVPVERPRVQAYKTMPIPDASIHRLPITDAPAHPNSDAIIANLAAQVASGNGGSADFPVWRYGIPCYETTEADPVWPLIHFRDEVFVLGREPREWRDPKYGAVALNRRIPHGAIGADGTDGALSIREGNRITEAWKFEWIPNPDPVDALIRPLVPSAVRLASIPDVEANPHLQFPDKTGVSASGLAAGPLCMGIKETIAAISNGTGLDHAISFAVIRAHTEPVWPATRDDGNTSDPNVIPEGGRIRLRRDVSLSGLHPIAQVWGRTLQTGPGGICVDKAGTVGVSPETGAGIAAQTGLNPWNAVIGPRRSYNVFAGFPWDQCELVDPSYGRPA